MVVVSLLSAPGLAVWLQKYLNLFLGPLLILVGMVLLGLIELPMSSGQGMQKLREKFENRAIVGAGLLGLLIALSFCPVSAALFFGSLIPLAVKYDSGVFLPALYGIDTGVAVSLAGVQCKRGDPMRVDKYASCRWSSWPFHHFPTRCGRLSPTFHLLG